MIAQLEVNTSTMHYVILEQVSVLCPRHIGQTSVFNIGANINVPIAGQQVDLLPNRNCQEYFSQDKRGPCTSGLCGTRHAIRLKSATHPWETLLEHNQYTY